jgi:hypothetical protein
MNPAWDLLRGALFVSSNKGILSNETLWLDGILQFGSGHSLDLLAEILGADTQMFLCNTRFYFPIT